jgi:hypothetical protein
MSSDTRTFAERMREARAARGELTMPFVAVDPSCDPWSTPVPMCDTLHDALAACPECRAYEAHVRRVVLDAATLTGNPTEVPMRDPLTERRLP